MLDLPAGWSLTSAGSVTSSSDLARDFLASGPLRAEGQAFLAAEQTKGRGRLGRSWVSKPGDGLYLSVILEPRRPRHDWPTLSFVTALAVLQAVEQLCPPLSLQLKWPNDLLLGDGKLGGLLLETEGERLIVGIGVNLANAPRIKGASHPPTDLASHCQELPATDNLARQILTSLHSLYQLWKDCGPAPLLARWQDRAGIVGRQLKVRLPDRQLDGICTGLGPDGRLGLQMADSSHVDISAGEVQLMGEGHAARS